MELWKAMQCAVDLVGDWDRSKETRGAPAQNRRHRAVFRLLLRNLRFNFAFHIVYVKVSNQLDVSRILLFRRLH